MTRPAHRAGGREAPDLDPRLRPLSKQNFDLAGDDARNEDDYTIREWVEAPGVRYVPVDGELDPAPYVRGKADEAELAAAGLPSSIDGA